VALPAPSYVWFRLRHVVALWVLRETGLPATVALPGGVVTSSVLWDLQNQPRPPLPYIGLSRREFPLDFIDEETITEVTTAATITLTASVVGETASLLLFGLRYAYTLQGADTTTDARDALLALVAADLLRTVTALDGTDVAVGFQPVTATASGADAIAFAGFGLGPVGVAASENTTLVATSVDYRRIQAGLRRAIIRLDLFWPERQDAFETLDAHAEALRSSLTREDTAAYLADRGVGVIDPGRVRTQNTSAVSGGATQRRRSIDVIFNVMSVTYRADNGIEDVLEPGIEVPA